MGDHVYAVVYSSTARKCLVFEKKEMGYYFGLKTGTVGKPRASGGISLEGGGIYYPKGGRLNGSGKNCFPGGGLQGGEHPIDGAVREFKEETGVDLVIFKEQGILFDGRLYYAVFFDVDERTFDRIFQQCQANIVAKEGAVDELRGLRDVSQSDARSILRGENLAINDDELALVKSFTLAELKAKLEDVFPVDEYTGWFNTIAQNFPG
jgi:8-oxo-dGTP pyrophosphatase MutT (NUDIX family)